MPTTSTPPGSSVLDDAAFAAALEAELPRLARLALHLAHAAVVEDLAQEASLRAWSRRRHLGGCPTCPPLYAGLVGVRTIMGVLRDPDSVVEEAMAARVTTRITQRQTERPRR